MTSFLQSNNPRSSIKSAFHFSAAVLAIMIVPAVLAGLTFQPRPSLGSVPRAESTIQDFKLPDVDNKMVQLKKLLEKGPVLIDFWATWCKPCVKYFPVLQQWHEKYGATGLTIVAINEDGPRSLAKIKPFARSLKVTFTVLVDENNEVMRLVRVQSLPTSILVAPDGTVITRHSGFQDETAKALETKIVELLPKKLE